MAELLHPGADTNGRLPNGHAKEKRHAKENGHNPESSGHALEALLLQLFKDEETAELTLKVRSHTVRCTSSAGRIWRSKNST